jgi:hypothetical protein
MPAESSHMNDHQQDEQENCLAEPFPGCGIMSHELVVSLSQLVLVWFVI